MTYLEDLALRAMLLKEFPRDSVGGSRSIVGPWRKRRESWYITPLALSGTSTSRFSQPRGEQRLLLSPVSNEREIWMKAPKRIRHSDSMRQAFLSALLPTFILFFGAPAVGGAQEVTTNITSSGLGTEVPLELPPDGIYNITGGTRPGGGPNLFHSFGDFSVGSGDVANFLNTQVAGSLPLTSNIIGRVTGGNISNIYGTIQTTGFDVDGVPTNFFLVNPNGIVFGPHGSVDVSGSVSFSTAQYLRLFDGVNSANFYADPAKDVEANSVFAMAPVIDFGFLSPAAYGFLDAPDPTATITVQGSLLQVPEGQSLSLVGGDITVQSGTLVDGTPQVASLLAPGGQINLLSVASTGEMLVPSFQTGPNINGASFTTMGAVTIKEGSTLDVSGQLGADVNGNPIGGNSGTVFVRGGQLVMEASTILAFTLGAVDGASKAVDIQVSQDVALTTGSSIATLAFGSGGGGDVLLTADTVMMEGTTILTGAFNDSGDGIAGNVVLSAREVSLMGGASIQSQSQSFTPGLGHGNVTIQGLPGAESGAAESVSLSGGSSLVSTTFSFGDGGQVAITAQSLTMEGPDTTIITSTNADGRGGDMVVRVQHASLLEGATIKTLTGSADPNAPAAATVTVQGLNGLMADFVDLSGPGSGIVSETTGSARSGHVTVEANRVSLTDGAVIQTGTLGNTGAGGDVTINAGSVDMSGGSRILSLSAAEDAGKVAIMADALMLNNVSIETFTTSGGRGGDVVLNVVGTVSLSNGAKINSSTSDAGRAGDITMNVGSLTLANHSEITNSSSGIEIAAGAGDAGNITIESGSTVLLNDSSITTEANASSGGQITINAPEMVRLTNSEVSTSVKGVSGESDGGNISIDPQFVILQNSQLTAQANAGAGGAINVIAGVFLSDPGTLVSAILGKWAARNRQYPVAGAEHRWRADAHVR